MKRIAIFMLLVCGAAWSQAPQVGQPSTGRDYADFASTGRSYTSAGWLGSNGRNYVQTRYPSGTIWRESFGNVTPGGTACWSGATGSGLQCQQEMAVASGSGETITTAATCGSAPFTNALKLPGSTVTVPVLYSYPPYLSLSTGATYDFFAYFCYDSAVTTGFDAIFQLGIPSSSNQAFQVLFNGNGSGQIFANSSTSSTAVSVSTGVWHLLHVHIIGGSASSYFNVDNGAQQTFTATSNDAVRMLIQGNFAGVTTNYYIGPMWITGSTNSGGWPLDMYADWVSQTSTPTAAKMQAGTHGGNGDSAATGNDGWTLAGTNPTFAFTATPTGCPTLSYPGKNWAAGTLYTGGSGTYVESSTTAAATGANWNYTWNGTQKSYTVTEFLCLNVAISNFTSSNNFVDQGGAGHVAYHICGSSVFSSTTCGNGGTPYSVIQICMENTGGSTVFCSQVSNQTWVAVVTNIVNGGTDTQCFYNIGVSSYTLLACGTGTDTNFVYSAVIGSGGSETSPTSFNTDFGPVMIEGHGLQTVWLPSPNGGYTP